VAPSSRLARDEQSIATVQHRAAPNPPTMAVIADRPVVEPERPASDPGLDRAVHFDRRAGRRVEEMEP
jgi:hypothetical protein